MTFNLKVLCKPHKDLQSNTYNRCQKDCC